MTEETPKDITPIKRKGIEMAVKGLRKKFPFIKGYEDDDSVDKYESAHYIDLIIDLNKLSDYMDVPVNPFWKVHASDPQYRKIYAIWSYLKFHEEDEYKYDKNISTHPGYVLGEEIKSTLNTMYDYLPEEYKLYYTSSTSFLNPPPIYQVGLKVNGYIIE